MAKVKIYLEDDETTFEAEEMLQKAMEIHSSGAAHDEDSFEDPAMVDVSNRMQADHKRIYQDMLNEINMALEQEYLK